MVGSSACECLVSEPGLHGCNALWRYRKNLVSPLRRACGRQRPARVPHTTGRGRVCASRPQQSSACYAPHWTLPCSQTTSKARSSRSGSKIRPRSPSSTVISPWTSATGTSISASVRTRARPRRSLPQNAGSRAPRSSRRGVGNAAAAGAGPAPLERVRRADDDRIPPEPVLVGGFKVLKEPRWERLRLWYSLRETFLGEPMPEDLSRPS